MGNRVGLALRLSSSCLVLSGYLALATVRGYSSAVLIIPLLLLPLAPLGEYMHRKYPFHAVISKSISLGFLCLVPFLYMTLGKVDAVVLLVVYIQAHLLMHQKEEKSYHYLFLMSFFLLLAASVQSPDASMALVLMFFLLSASWSFLTLRLYCEEKECTGTTGSLILPFETHAVPLQERKNPFDLGFAALIVGVSVLGLLMTAAAFPVIPRVPAGLLGREVQDVVTTGLTKTVNLRESSTIRNDNTPVMRVEFPEEEGGIYTGPLYWRSTTLPRYDESSWSRDRLENSGEPGIRRNRGGRNRGVGRRTVSRTRRESRRLVRQVVYMDNAPDQGLPSLDLVQELRLDRSLRDARVTWSRERDFSVILSTTGSRRVVYDAWSEVDDPSPAELRLASNSFLDGPDCEDCLVPEEYKLLTHHDLRPETIALAEDIMDGYTNVYDKARALERWLSGDEFVYTLEAVVRPDSTNAIDFFVMTGKLGHCEMFASAMALMLRSQGVPTRVVIGYRGGEADAENTSYTIRSSMAHLWMEVWFPDYGWIIFDPSPSIDRVQTVLGRLVGMISRAQLQAKMFWMREVEGFSGGLNIDFVQEMSLALFQSFGPKDDEGGGAAQRTVFRRWVNVGLVSSLLLSLTVYTLWRLRMLRWERAKRYPLTSDQQRAVRLYRRLRRCLERCGIDCAGKTAEELRTSLENGVFVDQQIGVQALDTYNTVRFGLRPMAEGEYGRLMKGLQALRTETS